MKGTGISRLQKRNRRNKTAAGNVRPVFKKMNLNTVMPLYTFLIVVPVLITSIVFAGYAARQTAEAELEKAQELADAVVITTETAVNRTVDLFNSVCYDTTLINFLSLPYRDDSYFTYTNRILPLMEMLQTAGGSSINELSLYMKNETIPEGYGIFKRFSSRPKDGELDKAVSPLRGSWRLTEVEGGHRLYYTQGIYSYYGDELLAILEAQISFEAFLPQNISSTAGIWFLRGEEIYASSGGEVPQFSGESHRDGEWVAVRQELDPLDLQVIIQLPNSASRQWIVFYIVLFAGVLVVSLLVYYIILRRVVQDTNQMIAQIRQTVDNDFQGHVSTESCFELSVVAEMFNDIVKQIHVLIEDGVEKKLAQRDAQITAMQCQINPHMLCNSLQVIQYQLELAKQYEISDMVACLGRIMRYSIDDKSILTTVELEVEHLCLYVEFQKLRMKPGELTFDVAVEESVKKAPMLKLLLQPLVENAISHGKPKGQPITIFVRIFGVGERIRFEVGNTGVRLDEAKVSQMREIIQAPAERSSGKSIGLQNINRRLNLFYSQESSLQVEINDEGDTVIAFEIPYNSNQLEGQDGSAQERRC